MRAVYEAHDLVHLRGVFPLIQVLDILSQVAQTLDHVHRHGVIPRDIKPVNIIVGSGDHVTLADFGIDKAAEGTHLMQTGTPLGTTILKQDRKS